MALDPVTNFAKVIVSTGYSAADVSVALSPSEGSRLPDPAVDGAFNLVWYNATDFPDPSDDPNVEIVRCTARSGDTLTIIRAQEGTDASVKDLARKTYKMLLAATQKTVEDIVDRANHTGQQAISTVAGLQDALDDKANTADLSGVAYSGTYSDLSDTPDIPSTFDDLSEGTTNKSFTGTEKTKLAGIASGATANSPDAALLARANHTGTQSISTVAGLQDALNAKAVKYLVAASAAPAETKAIADYVCDGTADDVEINAAITAAAVAGGEVELSEEVFNVTDTIILKSNVNVRGRGVSTKILLGNGVNKSIFTTNPGSMTAPVSNVYLSDLFIDGNKSNNPTSPSSGVRIVWGHNIHITDLRIQDVNDQGVEIVSYDDPPDTKYSEYVWIENRIITDPGRNGIYTGYKTTNYYIGYNYCYGGGSTAEGYGIMAGDYSVTHIEGNICEDNALYGIGHSSSYVSVIGNKVKNSGDTGIRINGGLDAFSLNTVKANEVSGNTVENAGGNGISIEGLCYNLNVSNNTIDYPGTHGIAVSVLNTYQPESVVVSSNVVTNGSNKGIAITSTGTGVVVIGNIIKTMVSQGISVVSDDVVVANNSVLNCGTGLSYNYGIWIQGNNNLVTGNKAKDTQAVKNSSLRDTDRGGLQRQHGCRQRHCRKSDGRGKRRGHEHGVGGPS